VFEAFIKYILVEGLTLLQNTYKLSPGFIETEARSMDEAYEEMDVANFSKLQMYHKKVCVTSVMCPQAKVEITQTYSKETGKFNFPSSSYCHSYKERHQQLLLLCSITFIYKSKFTVPGTVRSTFSFLFAAVSAKRRSQISCK